MGVKVEHLSENDVKKIVKEEVEKKTFKQDRLINLLYRRIADLEQMITRK